MSGAPPNELMGSMNMNAAAQCSDELMNNIREESAKESIPSVSPSTGRFLEMLASFSRAKNIVEVGCANGYATCYLINAAVKNGGRVTSFEKDRKRFEMAKTNMAGFIENGRLNLVGGDALEAMGEISGEVDFLFIDAMKRQYKPILEAFLPLLSKGAIVFSDDIYFQGVLEPEKPLDRHKSIVRGLREYLNFLKDLEAKGTVENYFYGYEDGMAVTRKL